MNRETWGCGCYVENGTMHAVCPSHRVPLDEWVVEQVTANPQVRFAMPDRSTICPKCGQDRASMTSTCPPCPMEPRYV